MKIDDIRQYIDYVMAGADTVAQRSELLTAQRQKVLAQQKQLAASLQEIDYKLRIYNSPQAAEIIELEQAYVAQEKASVAK